MTCDDLTDEDYKSLYKIVDDIVEDPEDGIIVFKDYIVSISEDIGDIVTNCLNNLLINLKEVGFNLVNIDKGINCVWGTLERIK